MRGLLPLIAWLGAFALLSWGIVAGLGGETRAHQTLAYLAMLALFVPPYLAILRRRAPMRASWRGAAMVVLVATVATPVTLESDPLRYVWDGLMAWRGVNPYKFAPADVDGGSGLAWSEGINHPELTTIYPPAAQLAFMGSAALNPYLWRDLRVDDRWKVLLGWKVLMGCVAAACVALLRNKRWDLLVLHPLYLAKVVGNAHVDALVLVALLVAMHSSLHRRHPRWQAVAIVAATLSKWLPVILLPSFLLHWRACWGPRRAWMTAVACAAVVATAVGAYAWGADGRIFASTLTYARHWSFFGYVHQALVDVLVWFGRPDTAVAEAKLLCGAIGIACGVAILQAQARGAIGLRLAAMGLVAAALALSPTLHPWYLLALLPLGLPYFRILATPWLWPVLGLAGHGFYVANADIPALRLAVYAVVTAAAARDLRLVRKHLLKRRRSVAWSPGIATCVSSCPH